MENGTVWSNSSESSDDSSSPALAHQRLTASNMLQTTLTNQLSYTPHKSSASTPSLSSNQEEEETETGEVFCQTEPVPNGHLQTSCSHNPDCAATDRASVQSADLSEASADLSCSCPDISAVSPVLESTELSEGTQQVSAEEVKLEQCVDLSLEAKQTEAETKQSAEGGRREVEASEEHQSVQEHKPSEEAPKVS